MIGFLTWSSAPAKFEYNAAEEKPPWHLAQNLQILGPGTDNPLSCIKERAKSGDKTVYLCPLRVIYLGRYVEVGKYREGYDLQRYYRRSIRLRRLPACLWSRAGRNAGKPVDA